MRNLQHIHVSTAFVCMRPYVDHNTMMVVFVSVIVAVGATDAVFYIHTLRKYSEKREQQMEKSKLVNRNYYFFHFFPRDF